MASVKSRHASPYWYGCFTLPNGERRQRSTKVPLKKKGEDTKAKALQIAIKWEEASRMKATASQAQKVLAEIVKVATGETFDLSTTHAYADRWVARSKRELADSTATKYEQAAKTFKAMVSDHVALEHVPQATIAEFRDAVAGRASIATANQALKAIKAMFSAAKAVLDSEKMQKAQKRLNQAANKPLRAQPKPDGGKGPEVIISSEAKITPEQGMEFAPADEGNPPEV